jgi:hypothetical protein
MVWLGARNQTLIESIARMRSRSMPYTRLEYMVQNTTAMLYYAEHESVVRAIIGQNTELAYQAMRGAVKSHLYNGKIDSPLLLGVSLDEAGLANAVADQVIAAWDFSQDIAGITIIDTAANALHGRIMQLPARV